MEIGQLCFHALVVSFDAMNFRRIMMMAATASGAKSRFDQQVEGRSQGKDGDGRGMIKIIKGRQRPSSDPSMQDVTSRKVSMIATRSTRHCRHNTWGIYTNKGNKKVSRERIEWKLQHHGIFTHYT